MERIFSNGFVWWNEQEIELRESLVRLITCQIKSVARSINPAIGLFQVETPCLVPSETVHSQFPQYRVSDKMSLRPESTAGTYSVMEQLQPKLPVILYQVNKSFRDESSDAMRVSKLRLREFWQLEYQLFYSADTKQDYHEAFVSKLKFGWLEKWVETSLPHYSKRTTDMEIKGLEVASFSSRNDFRIPVFEMSFGLDRLVYLLSRKEDDVLDLSHS